MNNLQSSIPVACLLLILFSGCKPGGPRIHPVKGTIVFEDGTPLSTEARIGFEGLDGEAKGRNARGLVKPDGTFVMSTKKRHDGAFAGRHKVIVAEKFAAGSYEGGQPPYQIDRRFSSYGTSSIEVVVEEGENDLTIEVTRLER